LVKGARDSDAERQAPRVKAKVVPPAVYVADTGTAKGRGVFAARSFAAGEVVEIAPVVIVAAPVTTTTVRPPPNVKVDVRFVREFKVLVFSWAHLAKVPNTCALALGYGSLYNSANPANMRYEADASESIIRFIAVRDIRADEELTINYNAEGGGAEWKDQNWFTHMEVTALPDKPSGHPRTVRTRTRFQWSP
jgi:hypothetical protein